VTLHSKFLIVPLFSLLTLRCFAQSSSSHQGATFPTPPRQGSSVSGEETPDESQHREKLEKDAEKKANQVRQAQLKRDTDKLLQLSTELKEYVEKTNENVLSVNVIKKAEEIEKLAHSVKEKMKGY
jgi:hypothetical protein